MLNMYELRIVPEVSQQTARKTKAHRPFLPIFLGVVALAGGALLLHDKLAPAREPGIITAVAKIGDIEETVLASGILKPVKLVAVGAQVSGRLTSLKVPLGQKVQKGDLIAEIDSLTQQNSLRTAEADLENMRAQRLEKLAALRLAETSLARQERTLADRASSRADYESAVSNLKAAQAQIKALDAQILAAEVAVDGARVNLGYTGIVTLLGIAANRSSRFSSDIATPSGP